MQQKLKQGYILIGLIALVTGCVESIDLPVKKSDVNFLVVDGYLNTANGEVNISLLRATLISETYSPFEANAVVVLEDSEGNTYALNELDSGKYRVTAPSLEAGKQYRIYIKTGGKEYRSAFVTVKPTPEIESVGWKAVADGTQIIIDTHDNTNETRYYRWTFEETWESQPHYISYWDYDENGDYIVREWDELIDTCFTTIPSTDIFITSTAGLSEDRVNDYELAFLPVGTEKLAYRYSVLVRQYAISKETYDYFEKLKKTSQDLRGLYSPYPSKVTGNIANISDPAEVVLGYFNIAQVTEKRIFITHDELPTHLQAVDEQVCYLYSTLDRPIDPNDYMLLWEVVDEKTGKTGMAYTTNECADCTLKGGVIKKPVFWP